jgi:hypothetical protein
MLSHHDSIGCVGQASSLSFPGISCTCTRRHRGPDYVCAERARRIRSKLSVDQTSSIL